MSKPCLWAFPVCFWPQPINKLEQNRVHSTIADKPYSHWGARRRRCGLGMGIWIRGVHKWVFDFRSFPCSNSHSHSHSQDYWFWFSFSSHSEIKFPLRPEIFPHLIMHNSNVIILAFSKSQSVSQQSLYHTCTRHTVRTGLHRTTPSTEYAHWSGNTVHSSSLPTTAQ